MKNINKYTKAELISRIKDLKSIKNDSSLFTKTMNFLLLFKSLILKFTMIAIVIKIFKKYSIFRRIWSFFNLILFSIFGITMIDIYEIEFLSNFLHNLIDVFSKLHTNILELFGKKVEIPIELPTKMGTMKRIDQSSAGNKENSKIFERFNKIINKEPEVIEDDTPIYKNKYVIIGGMLVLSCLAWYFYDDLKPIGSSILAWINTNRPRPDGNGSSSRDVNTTNSNWNISKSLKDWWYKDKLDSDDGFIDHSSTYKPLKSLKNWWNKGRLDEPGTNSPTNSDISFGHYFSDKGKGVDPMELTEKEVERRIMAKITGDRQIKFDQESSVILQQITHFNDKVNTFPGDDIRLGVYNVIRAKLLALSALSPMLYENLINDNNINNDIERFLEFEKEVTGGENHSDTYDEVAHATINEQEVWSDRGSSPRTFSPKQELFKDDSLLDKINKIKNDTEVVEAIPKPDNNLLNNLIQEADNFNDSELLTAVKETFKEDIGLKLDIKEDKQEIPKIEVDSNSNSDNSMDQYFSKPEINIQHTDSKPELTQEDQIPKSAFNSLFDSIRNRRKDVTKSPNIGQLGLQNQQSLAESSKLSPILTNKPSLNNLFEDTLNLFNEDPIDTDIDTSGESSQNLIEDKSLPIETINSLEKIKFDIDPKNHIIKFQFGEMKQFIKKIHTATNDGYITSFDKIEDNIPWDNRYTKKYSTGSRIIDIFIEDFDGNKINIYSNPIDTSRESSNKVDTEVQQERPRLPSNLLKSINSKRLEYGSPVEVNKELDEVQQSIEENESSEDDPLDPWKEVKVNIKTGDIYNRTVDIDFGQIRNKVTKLMIFTNDGEYNYFNPNFDGKSQIQTFKWDNKGMSNSYYKDLEIFKIVAMDGNKSRDIYYNKNVKFLPSYLEYLENYGQ
jgi:hypothetical protein